MHKIMNSACNVDYKIQNQLNTYREGTGEVNYPAPLIKLGLYLLTWEDILEN